MSRLNFAVAPAILDLRNNNKLLRDGCRVEGEKGVTWKYFLIYKLKALNRSRNQWFRMCVLEQSIAKGFVEYFRRYYNYIALSYCIMI